MDRSIQKAFNHDLLQEMKIKCKSVGTGQLFYPMTLNMVLALTGLGLGGLGAGLT